MEKTTTISAPRANVGEEVVIRLNTVITRSRMEFSLRPAKSPNSSATGMISAKASPANMAELPSRLKSRGATR